MFGADFHGADVSNADFDDADVTSTRLAGMRGRVGESHIEQREQASAVREGHFLSASSPAVACQDPPKFTLPQNRTASACSGSTPYSWCRPGS